MSTAALKGNAFLLKIADTYNGNTFTTVAACRSTSLTLNKATVDITNKGTGGGWTENLAGGGVKSATISASGVYADANSQLALITAWEANTDWNFQIINEANSTFTGSWNVDSLSFSGDTNVEQTFEITLSNSGEIDFVA